MSGTRRLKTRHVTSVLATVSAIACIAALDFSDGTVLAMSSTGTAPSEQLQKDYETSVISQHQQADGPRSEISPSFQATIIPLRPVHPQDEEFKALVTSNSISANAKAYSWIKECLQERSFVLNNGEFPRLCGLSDGNIDNLELRKQLVSVLALRGSFGGIEDLMDEGPNGRFRAYADDPAGHTALVAQAMSASVAAGEPVALATASVLHQATGDRLRASGDADGARAEYETGLTYSIASASGLAKHNGSTFDATMDPNSVIAISEYQTRLTSEEIAAAIQKGIKLSEIWQTTKTTLGR